MLLPLVGVAQSSLTHEQLEERYIKNSAWKYGMYSLEWQMSLDSALLIDSTFAYAWQQKAMPLFKQMKYRQGLDYLSHAVRHDPERWLDYQAFMKCIFVKDYESALLDFKQCLQDYDEGRYVMDHSYYFYMALCYIQMNDYDRAEAMLAQQVEEQRERDGDAWVHYLEVFYLGIAQYEQGHYQEAIDSFDRTLRIYPSFSDAGYYKGLSLMRLGEYDHGMSIIREAKVNRDYTINEDNVLYERYPYQINWDLVSWAD